MRDSGQCVLVIDDNVDLADVVRLHLADQDIAVRVAHNAASAEAAYAENRWDALIVDLLLPDRTGHRLLARLAAGGPLPPVFVMSGVFKGASARAQLTAITPVAGWFEKPFDCRVLTESVCQVLGRPFRRRAVRSLEAEQAVRYYESGGRSAPSPAHGVPSSVPVWDQNTEIAPLSGVSFGPVRSVVERRADPFRDGRTGFGRSSTPSASVMSAGLRSALRAGDLRTVPAPRLIGAFHVARETGEVAVEADGRRQILYFDAGRPVFAVSNRADDRLGVVIAERLGLPARDVREADAEARAGRRSLASVIVERGWVDRATLDRLQQAQMRRLLLDLFLWPEGRYVIRFRRRDDLPRIDLPEGPGQLVLDGVRERLTLPRLQALLPDAVRPMPSPNPPLPLFGLPIRDREAALLLKITGSRTVRALVDEAAGGLDERSVRALIYGLLALGVLVAGRLDAGGAARRAAASAC